MTVLAERSATTPVLSTWAGFLLMCLGMFMAILDIQVVATSLPTIQSALGISPEAMSWIQTAYLIAEVIAIPLTGLFTRILTLRWLFATAVSVFTLASIGCAFSGSFAVLLAFRVVQGFSGGVLIPSVFSAVFLLFPSRLHAVATTVAGVVAVLAPTIGPVVGGYITETWSWPWLFLINVIPGLVAAFATPHLLPRQQTNFAEIAKLDLARAGADGGVACVPRDRLEAGAAQRLAVAILRRSAIGERHRRRHFDLPDDRRATSGAAACGAEATLVCGRLCLELLPWRRAIRIGLSDAGVSRLRARP